MRRCLDEIVPLYVVFRTPCVDDTTLKDYISRLAVNLEAILFSTAPPPVPEAKAPPPKEVIYSETIKDTNRPSLIHYDKGQTSYNFVVWKVPVFISRPRARHHKPTVYFQPTASLKPAQKGKKRTTDDEYLPSGVPTALNLLQPFEGDPALAGVHPRLSAMRINKIAPSAPLAKELVRPIRAGQRRLFRAVPPLIWRMRYSRVHSPMSDTSILASLDMEVAHVPGKVTISDIALSLTEGSVKSVSDYAFGTSEHKPGDQLTYIYRVSPNPVIDRSTAERSEGHILSLTITATVHLSSGYSPTVGIRWKTQVDFTADLNPTLLKVANRLSNPITQQRKGHNPDALPQGESDRSGDKAHSNPLDVVLTVSGPPQVCVGEGFRWDVFIMNRSDKTRKLAVLVLLKRKRDGEKHMSRPSTASTEGKKVILTGLVTSAVEDENIVYAKQKNARSELADLICLTTDIRVGHLAPGACYTADLKFVALSSGVLTVDAVRLVDLATQEAADIRDLPSVIAVGKGD
ncbi:hypothetical protein M011DRAFT_401036 [Sporormia fimetaria CBS 119925]|uniref:Trafficking protein particle complex II-specific subunit 65 IgD3 domain-containing protein n=1 Tax=Sporormia fimetaria CBS 119925 TaxID=1340428 RepID=A0A6A6VEF6_9PLEO|nr:hypothetical protein M011DRAFT_401036 [Sporormia fimetaria CBS 119925]